MYENKKSALSGFQALILFNCSHISAEEMEALRIQVAYSAS